MGLLIGRRREQSDLDEWCRSRKAELVCVYGRRRVGKTYLVENTFRDRLAFAVTGSEDKRTATQLRVFRRTLKRSGAVHADAIRDWFDAFDCLRDLLDREDVVRDIHGRRVVFLDEFPWLAGNRSDFLVAFADFWNSWASKQDDIMVIVCGSATSWIIKNLFQNTGSMYNRITRRLYVAPFTLHDTERMAVAMDLGWSRDTVMRAYLVFGGLPYYLDMLDRRMSLAQNIDMLCLDDHASLRGEIPHLMEATLSKSPLYVEVLKLLSTKKSGLHRTAIVRTVGDNGNSLKHVLDDLERCGYIRAYVNPYEAYHPRIYQLIDPFLLFSFRFMEENRPKSWASFEGSPSYYAWRGNAFELACLSHLTQIKHAMGISAVSCTCFPWTSSNTSPGAQVDLAIERADGVTDLCEMKYTDEPLAVTSGLMESLRQKRSVFRAESKTKNTVHLALVSANGVASEKRAGDVAAIVTGDDLFAF